MIKSDPISEFALTVLQNASESDLERLVRGINNDAIIHLVKHDRHLQQRVFPGFRVDHLPWKQVPIKLARDAHDIQRRSSLLRLWLIFNKELYEYICKNVHVKTFDDDIVKALAIHEGDLDSLYWALLLDEQEDLQQFLREKDIFHSDVMTKVKHHRLEQQLEVAKAEILSLKARVKDLNSKYQSATQKVVALEKQNVDLLQENTLLQTQNDEMQRRTERLNDDVVSLQESHRSLQVEIDLLRSASQNYLSESEKERIYTVSLEAKINKLVYDKKALIHQKRTIHHQLKQAEQAVADLYSTDMQKFGKQWSHTTDTLRLHFNLERADFASVPLLEGERWSDWRHWQYLEQLLIRSLIESPFPASEEKLSDLDHAQKLLQLRWYLLEWMKINVFK